MSADPAQSAAVPTRPAERIVAIDILRGFALLGILIMNIQLFAMPAAAYSNPSVYGDLTRANRWVWTLSHIFADQKFMTIFSLLFGAGIILMSDKLDARGLRAWVLHYRRTFWLLLIGLAHAYLLWSGDVLVAYALCGFWVYWLRRLRPGWQMVLAFSSFRSPPYSSWARAWPYSSLRLRRCRRCGPTGSRLPRPSQTKAPPTGAVG